MKTMCGLAVSSVLLLFTTLLSPVAAIPTMESGPSAVKSTIQARAGAPTEADILNLATELFAVQLVGAQTTPQALKNLCTDFDLSGLAAGGYNTTSLKSIFCEAASGLAPALPPPDEVRALTIEYSSWIWIFQAVGALKNDNNRLKLLCHLIDVPSAFSVGQNGTLVKDQICNVGNGGELPTVPLPSFT